MADLMLSIIGSDGASAAFRGVAASFQELSKLAVDCTKAFEEQAKADRQLERYAKELTPAFKAQASAMQEQLGVSDDMVQSMQTMLLRFGEAPDQVEATTRALLDYSAATGEDALSATRSLLSSVESGKAAFKDLGLVYEKTGKASADLGAITEALAGKLGGSAAAEANSVAGQARIAAAQLDEMKESVGQLISEFVNKTGAVSTFTEAMRTLQEVLFNTTADKYAAKANAMTIALGYQATALDNVKFAQEDLNAAMRSDSSSPGQIEQLSDLLQAAKRYAEEAGAAVRALTNSQSTIPGLKGPDRGTSRGRANAEAAREEAEKEHQRQVEIAAEWEASDRASEKRNLEAVEKANADLLEEGRRADQDEADRVSKKMKDWETNRAIEADAYIRTMSQKEKDAARELKKIQDSADQQTKEFKRSMEEAGTAIAVGFINSLSKVLSDAMAGEEIDALEQFGEIAAGILEIAGLAIGTYFSMPTVGAAIGGLAGGLVKDATKKKKPAKNYGKKHDGGWVESYHAGGWPGASTDEELAMLQSGERVLSRSEVNRMGGKSGVDNAARGSGGGRGMTINVSTLDAGSFREYLGASGGRAFYNTLRTGQGMLTPVFGR